MSAPRVIVTRPEGQNGELAAGLRAIGWEAVEVPAIGIEPPESYDALDRALAGLDRFDWVLLTSRNAVAAMFDRLAVVAPGVSMPRLRFAAIGPGTAEALGARGVAPVWIPSRYLSEAVAGELPATAGQRVLRLRAEVASEAPAVELPRRGVEVVEAVAYRTVEGPAASRERLRRAVEQGVEAVIFTSASTVRGLVRLAGESGCAEALRSLLLVAIGPVTARALEEAGLRAGLVAAVHTIEGIVASLAERRNVRAGFPSR